MSNGTTKITSVELELELESNQTVQTQVKPKKDGATPLSENGLYLYDTRKEKNRPFEHDLKLGSTSQNVDYFKIIQKPDGFYVFPLNKEFKFFVNSIDISAEESYGPVNDGDIISADKHKYIVNKIQKMTIEEANKIIGKYLVSTSSSVKNKELAQKEKDIEQSKIKLNELNRLIESYKATGVEYKANRQKIEELTKRCHEIEAMNLQALYDNAEKERKTVTKNIDQWQNDIIQIRQFLEKSKKVEQSKQEVQIQNEKEKILNEEQELLLKLQKIQEAKKKLGAA